MAIFIFSSSYPFNIYIVTMWYIRRHQKLCPKLTVVCPVGISLFFWQPATKASMFICLHAIVLDCDVLIPVQHMCLCSFTIRFSHANNPWVLLDMYLPPQVLQVWLLDNGVFCIKSFPSFFSCHFCQVPFFFPTFMYPSSTRASVRTDQMSYQQLLVPESHKFVIPFPQKWNSGFFKVYSIKAFLLYFVNTFCRFSNVIL